MNTARTKASGNPGNQGYTLLELLAVMAIMAILLAVMVPSISGLNESNNITRGGQVFADEITLARQIASSRNITVEVRCINIPTRSANGYTGLQLWSPGGATSIPVSRLQTMPDGIAISQDKTTVSSLFSSYQMNGVMPAGSPASGDSYWSFTINPSGMVGPLPTSGVNIAPDMSTLTVGVLPARYAANTALPANYVLIQINPVTAATVNYRP
jgi:uncharacterized protein (TIGR02596 family)